MNKYIILSSTFLFFIPGCATTSKSNDYRIYSRIPGTKVFIKSTGMIENCKKIAVTDFKSPNSESLAGMEIADRISILLMSRGYDVIERDHLKTLLKENYLKYVGVVDQENLKEVRKLPDVDAVITGTISAYNSSIGGSSFGFGNISGSQTASQSEVSFSVKMFKVETGELLLSGAGALALQKSRGELTDIIIDKIFYNFPRLK